MKCYAVGSFINDDLWIQFKERKNAEEFARKVGGVVMESESDGRDLVDSYPTELTEVTGVQFNLI